eukprot:CAMPEP_0173469394 /NCGR_PEP_ID=MMETSP1357-20121228/77335_1 /TAXON_ID=77926 /ORGANISM="Hemiselmis rufescens, Strain PCC563" /LENGTH=113 /DNA_ID=CAMNT_0014437635 /DNA_START=3398 /DNA_END=3736 /DNA_ORIENTATION=+
MTQGVVDVATGANATPPPVEQALCPPQERRSVDVKTRGVVDVATGGNATQPPAQQAFRPPFSTCPGLSSDHQSVANEYKTAHTRDLMPSPPVADRTAHAQPSTRGPKKNQKKK